MTTFSFDGFQAVVEFDETAGLFHGEVIGLRDVITFQGKSVAKLRRAFKDSIADYVSFCRERGEMQLLDVDPARFKSARRKKTLAKRG